MRLSVLNWGFLGKLGSVVHPGAREDSMTTLDLMVSAPLPARQPIGGQVPEVTPCSLIATRLPSAVLSSQGGRSL